MSASGRETGFDRREHVAGGLASFASDLRHWAGERPDDPALTVVGGGATDSEWTYRDLDEHSNRLAHGLRAVGVEPGSRVAHVGRNRAGYVALLYAASKLRAAVAGINWRLTAAELRAPLATARPSVVVVDPEFLPAVEQALSLAGLDPTLVDGEAVTTWAASWPADDPGDEPRPDDTALIFFTSGTTGTPKGAMLSVGAMSANMARPTPWHMRRSTTTLVCSPVFHAAGTGWIYLPVHAGGHCLLLRDPSPADILGAIERFAVTHALLVPAVIRMLVEHPSMATTDTSSLETVAYGASPISPTLLRATMAALGCDLAQAYGMTETGGPITYLGPEDHDAADPHGRLRSAGRPAAGVEVQVTDVETGDALTAGVVGEIWTRSDQQMSGYLDAPEATQRTITPDGWLRTGDAGYSDADGYIYLTDRLSDVIVTGGENVYPVEIENVLLSHPSVSDAAVIGIPDERWGETVAAVVVATAPDSVDADALIAWCRDRIAHFKAPTSVDVVAELPRNPAGKVLRRVLREPYWRDHGRSVG